MPGAERSLRILAGRVQGDIFRYLMESLRFLKDQVDIDELVRVIGKEDPLGYVDASGIENIKGIISGLDLEISNGLILGGRSAARELGMDLSIDLTRASVTKWKEKYLNGLVSDIGNNSKAAVKYIIEEGIDKNRHPLKIARDVKNGIGLNDRLSIAVARKRSALEAAGVPEARIEKTIARYHEKLLKYRAEMIARTESVRAINHGKLEMWKQLKDGGSLPPSAVKIWLTSIDEKVCPICRPLHYTQKKLGEEFESNGFSSEAPPIHTTCRCTLIVSREKRERGEPEEIEGLPGKWPTLEPLE